MSSECLTYLFEEDWVCYGSSFLYLFRLGRFLVLYRRMCFLLAGGDF